jgi:hypothetical protein
MGHQEQRRLTRRRAPAGLSALAAAVLVAGCAATPSAPSTTTRVPTAPVVSAFRIVAPRTEAPVTAVLAWTVSDANGDDLTCRLDTDGDGTLDRTVTHCDSGDSVLVSSSTPGTAHLRLEVDDGTFAPVSATADLTVTPGPAEPFTITLSLAPTMAPEYQLAFQRAADRWAQVVKAGLPDQALVVPDGFLGWVPGFDGVVDDLLIAARDVEMDGPGGTLGQAGALVTRPYGGQSTFGVMEFDTADLARLAAAGRLDSVILHEMGHVLGLGSNWLTEGVIDNAFTDPTYNAPAGVAAWHELGGTGGVPVEAGGGVGTAWAHWRESTFDNELMTGYSDRNEALSRLTIAALADRGYGVDLAAADPYSLPGTAGLLARSAADLTADPATMQLLTPGPGGQLPGA